MGYVSDNLMPNEQIIYTARIHPAVFIRPVIFFIFSVIVLLISFTLTDAQSASISSTSLMVLCGAGFLLISAIGTAIQSLLVMTTTEFAVTNRRIVAKTGFIRRHTLEILLQKVESVRVNQDILARMLDFGTVTVTGTGGTRETFLAISEPIAVRKTINRVIEEYSASPPVPAAQSPS